MLFLFWFFVEIIIMMMIIIIFFLSSSSSSFRLSVGFCSRMRQWTLSSARDGEDVWGPTLCGPDQLLQQQLQRLLLLGTDPQHRASGPALRRSAHRARSWLHVLPGEHTGLFLIRTCDFRRIMSGEVDQPEAELLFDLFYNYIRDFLRDLSLPKIIPVGEFFFPPIY